MPKALSPAHNDARLRDTPFAALQKVCSKCKRLPLMGWPGRAPTR
jgi:hypothetical protein